MGKKIETLVFDPTVNYSYDVRLLFDLRRYIKVVVSLHVVFVSIIVISFGLVWSQITKYDLIKPENVNLLNGHVITITQNAATMSAAGVPVAQNIQFASTALAAAVAALYNASASASASLALAPPGARRALLDGVPVTEQSLLEEDYRMRKMMYGQVHRLLEASNAQLDAFNATALSDLLEATALQIRAVNFSGFAQRYDRTLGDVEATAHFGVVASGMLGLAAAMTNTTLPTMGDVLGAYSKQQAAVAAAAPPSHSCT